MYSYTHFLFVQVVDYEGIKASEEFQMYKTMTRELLRVDIENSTREEKLSFFINVYNALVIHANIERGPPTNLWGRYKVRNNSLYIIYSFFIFDKMRVDCNLKNRMFIIIAIYIKTMFINYALVF